MALISITQNCLEHAQTGRIFVLNNHLSMKTMSLIKHLDLLNIIYDFLHIECYTVLNLDVPKRLTKSRNDPWQKRLTKLL